MLTQSIPEGGSLVIRRKNDLVVEKRITVQAPFLHAARKGSTAKVVSPEAGPLTETLCRGLPIVVV